MTEGQAQAETTAPVTQAGIGEWMDWWIIIIVRYSQCDLDLVAEEKHIQGRDGA